MNKANNISEAPKDKPKDPTEWGAYFKNEIKMLKVRRGINQGETWDAESIKTLIGEMVLECQKPPYNQIDKVIIQRVITAAVIDDQEFFSFNVAWVRKALNKWWYQAGWKLLEKMQREKEIEAEKNKPIPVENPHLDVKVMVDSYVNSLVKPVPKLSKTEIEKEGQERSKQISASATYNLDHIKNIQINIQHEIYKVTNEGYSHLKPVEKVDFKIFVIDGIYKVNCASLQDAEEICTEAKRRIGVNQ